MKYNIDSLAAFIYCNSVDEAKITILHIIDQYNIDVDSVEITDILLARHKNELIPFVIQLAEIVNAQQCSSYDLNPDEFMKLCDIYVSVGLVEAVKYLRALKNCSLKKAVDNVKEIASNNNLQYAGV